VTSKHLAARLLSRKNQLSSAEKQEIFGRVMDDVAPSPRWFRRPAVWAALAGAMAALVIVPLAIRSAELGELADSFGSRGKQAAIATFEVSCPSQPSGCQRRGTLVFDVQASAGYRYFAAFARRSDGTILWYFPDSATAQSLDLDARVTNGVLDRGIALGDEHQAGSYQLYGIFSGTPLSRDDIKARFQPGAANLGPGTAVVTKDLAIQ
jgi:hypothetical protein